MPLRINHIGIKDGEIHYRDPFSSPKVDVALTKFTGRLSNLTNSEDLSESLAATAHFTGVALEDAQLALDGKIDPYAKLPTFHLTAELEKLEIEKMNDFLRAYANVDAERGLFSVYTEIDAKDGGFEGYVKPFIKDLKVMNWKDDEDGVLKKAWETLVQGAVKLLENDPKNQVASRVPLRGRIEQPDADIGTTVLTLLRNAFIQALQAGLDTGLDGDEKGIDIDGDGEQDQKSEKKEGRRDKDDDKDKKSDKDADKRLSRRDSKRD